MTLTFQVPIMRLQNLETVKIKQFYRINCKTIFESIDNSVVHTSIKYHHNYIALNTGINLSDIQLDLHIFSFKRNHTDPVASLERFRAKKLSKLVTGSTSNKWASHI